MALNDYLSLPAAASGLSPAKPATAWAFGSWVVAGTSTTNDRQLSMVSFQCTIKPALDTTHEVLLEIGIGNTGSEVTVLQIPFSIRKDTAVGYFMTSVYTFNFPELYTVPAGTQVSVRVTDSLATDTTYNGVKIGYEDGNRRMIADPVTFNETGIDANLIRTRTPLSCDTRAFAITGVNNALYSKLLLDNFPSSQVAYSLRKLRAGYTGNCIRVRRSSDNSEQDIGFFGIGLDEAALTAFVGSNSAFIVTWYDQSGNAINASQSTAAKQPRIVNAGTIHKIGSNPSAFFDGANYNLPLGSTFSGSFGSLFSIQKNTSDPAASETASGPPLGNVGSVNGDSVASNSHYPWTDGVIYHSFATTERKTVGNPTPSLTNLHLFTAYSASAVWNARINGSQIFNTTTNTVGYNSFGKPIVIGMTDSGGPVYNTKHYYAGYISEVIVYTSDQLSNRAGIEDDILYFYSLYRLTAGVASYTFSGKDATLNYTSLSRTLTADARSYTITRYDALFKRSVVAATRAFSITRYDALMDRSMVAQSRSYTITMQPALFDRSIIASSKSFIINRVDALFKRSMVAAVRSFTITRYDALFKRTMTAQTASYTLTGIASLQKRSMVADTRSYTLTGLASLQKRSMVAAVRTFTITRYDANFLRSRVMTADSRSYTINRVDALFKRSIVAAVRSFTITRYDAAFKRSIVAQVGTFTITRNPANFPRTYRLTAEKLDVALTGNTVGFAYFPVLNTNTASYTITGNDVALTYTPAGAYTITATTRAFTITRQPALFKRSMVSASRSFTMTTVAATFKRSIVAASRSYTLTPQNIVLSRSYRMTAAVRAFTVAGQDIRIHRTIKASTGAYTITRNDANLSVIRIITMPASTVGFTLTSNAANLLVGRMLPAAAAEFTIYGNVTPLYKAYLVQCSLGSFVLTPNDAQLIYTSGLLINYWNGSTWIPGRLKAWTGSEWKGKLKRYNGSTWN